MRRGRGMPGRGSSGAAKISPQRGHWRACAVSGALQRGQIMVTKTFRGDIKG